MTTLKEYVAVDVNESVRMNETGYVPALPANGVIVIATEVPVTV